MNSEINFETKKNWNKFQYRLIIVLRSKINSNHSNKLLGILEKAQINFFTLIAFKQFASAMSFL